MSDEKKTSLSDSHELRPLLNGNLAGNCDSGHQEDDSDSGESQNEHPETPEQTSNGSNTTGDRNVNHYQQPNNKSNGPVSHVSPIPDEKIPGRSVPRETDEIYLAEKADGGGFAYTTPNPVLLPEDDEDGDEECTDSESDEPSNSYEDPREMEFVLDASQPPTPQKSCCFGRSDSLEKKFEQLLFRIHYSRKREMEEILDLETERNQAKLLVMKDKEGSPCLMEAITRQSAECTEALLQRFKRLDPVFELNCIDKKEALRSKDGKNLFHLGTGVNDREVIDAIDMCHLKDEIADMEDCGGTTPLIVACERGNREMIRRLVNLKAKIDHIDKRKLSPIYLVAKGGCAETLHFVLVQGSRKLHDYWSLLRDKKYYQNKGTILQAIVEGETSGTLERCFYSDEDIGQIRLCLQEELKMNKYFVHQVCRTSLTDLLLLALDFNENLLNSVDGEGMTPLMRATEARQLEVVKLILGRQCGKDTVSKTTEDRKTALLIACDEGYPEIVRCIMEKSDVQLGHCDSEEKNAFHYAAKHDEVLRVLIDVLSEQQEEYKEHLRKKDINEYIPLHIAAAKGLHKNVELLLNNGVPYDIKSRSGRSALHCSACSNLQTVKALVEFVRSSRGEDAMKDFINAGDSRKDTSLILAATLGRWQTVSYLLKNGADMKGNQDNETPLHFAASSGCTKTVGCLLEGNVIHQENRVGETAAMFAAVLGKTDALQLLLDKGARLWATSHSSQKRRTCLDWAVANKDSGTASLILKDEGWREAMEKSPDGADGLLAEMVKVMPDVAIEVLDKCTTEDNQSAKCHDFFALQTVQEFKHRGQPKKKVTSLQALENMAKFSRDECLRHDVVQMFLKKKWTKCAKLWYMFAFFLYSVFLVSLTTYIGLVRNGTFSHNNPCVIFSTGICVTFAGLSIIKELFQLIHKKWEYFYDWATYMEFVMYICVFIFLFPQSDKSNRQWQAGSIAIFLGWINFIGFLKKLPTYGIYIIMAKKIFVTFLKVFLPVGFFVMAFAMTFFVLFRNYATTPSPGDSNGFETIPRSLVTAFAMMVGEINYREVFLNPANPNFALIMLFLVIFLVLMTILLMNLLTGLAVGDTGEVLRRAMTEKRIKQAMLIVEMDKSLNKYPCWRADFMEPYEESSEEENCLTKLTKLLAKTVFPDVNMEKENQEKASFECQCSSLKADLDDIKATLKAMQKSSQENGLRYTITGRRKNTQLLNKSRRGHGGTL